MDPYTALSLVDYIQLLHRGLFEKSLYLFFEPQIRDCTPVEVNIAIDNLLIRYTDMKAVEKTVARFIRAVSPGLDKCRKPDYGRDCLLSILSEENQIITDWLNDLKRHYMEKLPGLERGDTKTREEMLDCLDIIQRIKAHYLKLQNDLFPALENAPAPARCLKLMWHLQDAVGDGQKKCEALLVSDRWDGRSFNRIYGQMYYLAGSLVYREEKILFPVAFDMLWSKTRKDPLNDS